MGRKALNPDKCTKCGGNGPFDRDKRKLSGHASWCRSCKNKANRKWAEKNRDKELLRNRKWYAEHKDKAKEYSNIWKQNHPNYFIIRATNWRLSHLEQARTNTRNRQARRRGADGKFTKDEWLELKNNYGRCAYCNKETDNLQADHVIPIILGGSNNISNVVPACQSCNSSKNGRPLLLWMLSKI